MRKIKLIIACEECGHVQHLEVSHEYEIDRLVAAFRCPGSCSATHRSYISIGELSLADEHSFAAPAVGVEAT